MYAFWISGEIPSFTDAMFETVSGFTTTGASILPMLRRFLLILHFFTKLHALIGGMGSFSFPACYHTAERWLKYKSYEGESPWTISVQACSKDEIYRKDTLYNLFWHDHIGIYFPYYWQMLCLTAFVQLLKRQALVVLESRTTA